MNRQAGFLAVAAAVLAAGCTEMTGDTQFAEEVAAVRAGIADHIDAREFPVTSNDALIELLDVEYLVMLNLDNSPINDEGLGFLRNLTMLRHLSLSNTFVSDEGLATIVKQHPQLSFLRLDQTTVGDAGIAHLPELKQLVELSLWQVPMGDEGCRHLARVTSLRRLSLDETPVTDRGIEHLRGLKDLQRISLWQTQVTDEGVARLQKALPKLEINR